MAIKFTRPARRDVDGIVGYIAKDNPKAAEVFANSLVQKFAALHEAPLIGRDRDDFGKGLRSFPFGSYPIFYRSADFGITIVRVLHGARNLPDVLGG